MTKKIFAIVGYTQWGKSNTLYELFQKKQFFPLKSPILSKRFGNKNFTVINASNEDRPTEEYLNRLTSVLQNKSQSDTIFVITISLIFEGKLHNLIPVFKYLNSLKEYEITYCILLNSWKKNRQLRQVDIDTMKNEITHGKCILFESKIDESDTAFKSRTEQIALVIGK